ncbi:MAG: F0F1 ATP synthase subunit epsilon [Bacteroidales bacterium]
MYIDIITPTEQLFSGNVQRVKVPGAKGSFEMLHNHAPIVSILEKGIITLVDEDNKSHTFEIDGGVIESAENKTIVLVD